MILAVCSKNDPETAARRFQKHSGHACCAWTISPPSSPTGRTRPEHPHVSPRALGIGLDAMVFVDDDPAERDIVRRHLPEVEVPELPDDPAASSRRWRGRAVSRP